MTARRARTGAERRPYDLLDPCDQCWHLVANCQCAVHAAYRDKPLDHAERVQERRRDFVAPRKQRQKAPRTPVEAKVASTGVQSELEAVFANRLERAGLPLGVTQHPVCPGRRWRFDRAWPAQMVAVEVQGGIWTGGRHARGSGIAKECEKFSTAAAMGWRILPVTRDMIEDGTAVALIAKALEI